MKLNYYKILILLILPLNLLGQVVTQTESAEGNFFPMPGWNSRKGIVAEFSRVAAATTVSPSVPALANGTSFAGGAPAAVTGGGTNVIMLNSFVSATDTAFLISKPFDFSNNGGVNPTLSFWVYRDAGAAAANDRLEVFWSGVSPGAGATLTPINHQSGSNVIPRRTASAPTAINGAGWYEYRFTIPTTAPYNTKRNYFVIRGIAALGNNMYLDKFTVNTYPSAMLATDVQFNLVQQNLATISSSTTDQMILGVRCVVGGNSGCGALTVAGTNNPVKLDSLLFNTNGCSNISTDILNAKVYYTGGSDRFSTGYVSPFPATTGIVGASYPKATYGATLTGGAIATNLDFINTTGNCFYLEYDTTYFWLVYDLKAGAGGGNFVDGDFRGAVVGGPTTCPSPVGSATCIFATTYVFALAGAAQISDVSYCVPVYSYGTSQSNYTNNDYIHQVNLLGYGGTAINASTNDVNLQLNTLPCFPSCRFVKHPPDYEFRSPNVQGNTVTLQQGVTYSITVQVGTYFSSNNISAWIDFNRDGVFDNGTMTWAGSPGSSAYTGERLGYASLTALGTATWTFTVPATGATPAPFQGSTRLRVREWFAASAISMHPCNPGTYGESEDFIVTIIPNCNPSYKLWLGNTNDWNNPANWCPSVPTISDSVVISKAIVDPGTRQYFNPVIKSGIQANCKSLTISNQDSLFVDAANPGSTALKIAGNLNNNGYMNVVGASTPTNNAVFPNSKGTLLNFLITPLCGKTYKAGQTQTIYLASDLSQLGMQAGDKITAIQLNVKNNDVTVPTRFYNNFAIGFAYSFTNAFTSTVPIAGVTTVYTSASQPIVFGVNTFTLASPIIWDGVNNIVIQYTFTNPASTGSANNDYIDITQSTGRNSTLVLGRLLTSGLTVPAAGSFVSQVATDITANGSPIANVANTVSALMTLRPNATFIWDRPYGKPKLVVQGDFINNGNFNAGKSLFVMDSSRTQFISGSRAISFYTFSMAKSAANRPIVLNNDSVSIQDTFYLGTGQMIMNGKPLFMTWSNPAAFSRINLGTIPPTAGTGLLISENPNSIVNWTIGNYVAPTSTRTIPFGSRLDTTSAVPSITYIPLTFNHKQGNMGVFKAATKYWASNTLPDPPTVSQTNIFNSTASNAVNVVDRYWLIGKTGPQNPTANYPVADIAMRMSTNATAPQVTERPTTMSALRPGFAQPWRVTDLTWLRISSVATTNVSTVNSALGNGTTITYTTSAVHSFAVGQAVSIAGAMTPAGYNVINAIITAVPSTTTFSVAGTQTGVSTGTSTATGAPSCGSGQPAATPYNQQQTTLNYTQSYGAITAANSDSVRVTNWDWPTVPTLSCPNSTPSGPFGDLVPWTISVNTSPLGTSFITPIITTDSAQDVSCIGGTNGRIYISVTGSVSPYTYLWNDGAITEDRTNLAVGSYTVTVTGADGSLATKSFVIGLLSGAPVITTDTIQNVNCIGAATGQIAISVSSGIAPYSYLWNDGSITEDRSNLTPGVYTVTVTGCNGATAIRTFTLNLVSNVPIITTDSLINLNCINGSSSGKIYISVSNGVAPYSYLWNDGVTLEDRTNLTLGNYTVTVTGCNGVTSSKTFTVGYSVNNPLIVTDSVINTTCAGLQANGKIFITVNGGLNPYLYQWSDGATIEDRQSLVAGNYTVTVTGCNGLSSNKTFTVTMPTNNPVIVLDSLQNASCAGVANGGIYVTVSNGIEPYSYQWSDGSTSQDRPSLAAGNYTLTVTGCNGFSNTSSYVINSNNGALGSVGLISGNNAICTASDYTYTLPLVSNAAYYAWTVPANASVISGQGTNTVVIRFTSSFINGAVSVIASNSCQSSSPVSINVSLQSNSTIGTVGVITGAKTGVCPGSFKFYSVVSVTNATNYTWIAPVNSVIVSGQGTRSVKVQFDANFTSGTLSVSANNACVSSNSVSIAISSIPSTPGTITGPVTNLCGSTSTYSVSSVAGATTYTWTSTNPPNISSGQGTQISQLTWPATNIASATVCVTANNTCGSSLPKCISGLTTLPLKPVKINGPRTVCANQANLVYSVAAEPGVSYAWGVPAGCSIVSGQGSATATINWGTVSGNIRVTAYNQCGSQAIKYQSISVTCRENESGNSAYIVPNPSNGVAVLYLPNNEEHCTIIIHDLLGRVVFTNETFNDKVDLELGGYHDGIYLVSVMRADNFKEVFKMVIEK